MSDPLERYNRQFASFCDEVFVAIVEKRPVSFDAFKDDLGEPIGSAAPRSRVVTLRKLHDPIRTFEQAWFEIAEEIAKQGDE